MRKAYPSGCFVCRLQSNNDIIGYVFSLPLEKNISSVAAFLEVYPLKVSPTATCFFIHDLAIRTNFHRRGFGTALFVALLEYVKTCGQFEEFRLMSMIESGDFWSKGCGFTKASKEDKPENQWAINLIGYENATPMSRTP